MILFIQFCPRVTFQKLWHTVISNKLKLIKPNFRIFSSLQEYSFYHHGPVYFHIHSICVYNLLDVLFIFWEQHRHDNVLCITLGTASSTTCRSLDSYRSWNWLQCCSFLLLSQYIWCICCFTIYQLQDIKLLNFCL